MARINIRGKIVPNDYKWFYDLFGEDSTSAGDVQKIIDQTQPGETIDVYINSPGGVISVGSEIYTILKKISESGSNAVKIHIIGEAHSAASIIAMAAKSEMSPTALMMVHCVSTGLGNGNHNDFEHAAEMLRNADEALCTAYMNKAGMSKEEALDLMEHETWLTAEKAKELGLVDEIMFDQQETVPMTASAGFELPTEEQLENARNMLLAKNQKEMEDFEMSLSLLGEPIKNINS